MKILFLTHYYPPEVGAPQARISELAQQLKSFSHDVKVLTGFPNYPTGIVPERYRGKWLFKEVMNGVPVVRTAVYATPNAGFLRRILNHLSFTCTCLFGVRAVGPCDIIITECPPLFLGLSGILIAWLKGARHVFNVADLWPESAIEMGVLKNRLLIALSQRMADLIYRYSSLITTTAAGQKYRLEHRGIRPERIVLVPNGVDTDFFRPGNLQNGFRSKYNLIGKFVALYGGTHGLAQGLETILLAARVLKNRDDILFLFVGEGAEKKRLVELSRQYGLPNVVFLDAQPRQQMPEILNAADVGVVCLRKLHVFRDVLPSKMFEYMSSATPIIAAVEGESQQIIESAKCGITVEPESPEKLADAVTQLAADERLRLAMGKSGRAFVIESFSRERIAKRLETALMRL